MNSKKPRLPPGLISKSSNTRQCRSIPTGSSTKQMTAAATDTGLPHDTTPCTATAVISSKHNMIVMFLEAPSLTALSRIYCPLPILPGND